jgi:hypothetical protein
MECSEGIEAPPFLLAPLALAYEYENKNVLRLIFQIWNSLTLALFSNVLRTATAIAMQPLQWIILLV